ncbi:MAG: glycosyltransferase family 39 protein [Candidatus Lindowbacteria bacterium]|nr:glycosyltransferase family 39 protein [Candidatus Lindowbacteria bacterium]
MKNQTKPKRAAIFVPVLLTVLYLALSPFSVTDGGGSWLDIDYGLLVNNGRRVLGGELLYRDVWSMYGPAEDHFIAFLYMMFGESLRTLRMALAVTGAITAYLCFRFVLKLTSIPFALALSAFLLLVGPLCVNYPYPSWFCAPLGLSMVLFQHVGWKKQSLVYYALAGVAAGVIFSFKQNWGIFALLALFATHSFASLMHENGRDTTEKVPTAPFLCAIWIAFPILSLILIGKHFSIANLVVFCLPAIQVSLWGVMLLKTRSREGHKARGFWLPAVTFSVGFAAVVLPWVVFFMAKLGLGGFYDCLLRSPRIFVNLFYYPLRKTSPVAPMLVALGAAQGVMILGGKMPALFKKVFIAIWCVFSLFLIWETGLLVRDGLFTRQVSMYNERAFAIACYFPLAAHLGFGFLILKDIRDSRIADRNRLHLSLSLWIYSVATFLNLYPLIEIYHLIWIMPPIALLGAVFLHRSIGFWNADAVYWRKIPAYCLAMIVPIFFALFFCLPIFRFFVEVDVNPLRARLNEFSDIGTRRGGVLMPKRRADSIRAVVNFVEANTEREDYVLDMTGSLFNFLADRRNPTRWGIFYRGLLSPNDVQRITYDLDATRPRAIVNSTWGEYTFYNFYRGLYWHFYSNYEPTQTFLEYQVMLRRETNRGQPHTLDKKIPNE